MIKIIEPSSWDFDDPITSLVKIHSRGIDGEWMHKRAACFTRKDFDELPSMPKHAILHVTALGDYETYGFNRNGDAYTARGGVYPVAEPIPGGPTQIKIAVGNVQTHPTFVEYGRVFKNHSNQDPSKSFGPILKSAHNERMSRTELLIAVPEDVFADDLQKLASGDPLGWSMACKVPFDISSCCGNKARTKDEYCPHARDHLTATMKCGEAIFVFNDGMKFFDISRVHRPADRICLTLQKAAEFQARPGGAALAAQLGLTTPPWMTEKDHPQAAAILKIARKMAELEKKVPVSISSDEKDALKSPPVQEEDMQTLRKGRHPDDTLADLAGHRICLSMKDFYRLISPAGRAPSDSDLDSAESLLPGVHSRLSEEDGETLPGGCDLCGGQLLPPEDANHTMRSLISGHSLDEGPLMRRMHLIVIKRSSESSTPVLLKRAATDAPTSSTARRLALEYAAYQASFIGRHGGDDDLARRLVIRNRV